VIVAHDGAAWLPHIAEALLGQTRPVQRVVAVDTGSRDRSGAVLAELLGRSVVFGMDRKTGYGAAIAHALRHRAANTNVPGPAGLAPGERTEWVWLLHDDCEPAPDALEQLLRGAAESRSAAVLGPKVMDWADRRVLLETGITIDGAGRRITGIEPREVDQGQHDGDRDVMAVSSAGMLVRRDVWDQVGGFDPAMPLLRDDVDFCWRVHAAGHRVRVITDAVVYHLEATARNRRTPSAAPRPRRMDRHNALLTLLANLPLGPALSALAGNLVLSALRTVFFLLAKRPRAALDEFTGVGSVLGHPLQLAAARRQRARGRRAAYGRLRADLPPGHSVRRLAEFAASVFYTSTQIDTAGSHHATDDPTDDDFMLVDNGLAQRILTHPGVLLVAGLTIIALVAERSLLGAGTLTGGALTPAWGGVGALWHEYLQGFHPAGIGSDSSTPPYVAVIATLATVLGGKPWLAIDVIMIGAIPLAGLAAFLATRRVTKSVLTRVWAAVAYALLPVGMGAVAGGRVGSAVVFVLIPVIALLAARIFTEAPRRARRAAWATGLVVAIAAAFVPLIWVVAVLAALLGAVAFRRSGRGMLINLGITAVVPPVLLLPWTLDVVARPSLLFLEAGNKVPGLATAALPARSLLLLSPGGPGLPPFWVTGGLALAALGALLLTARRSLVMAGWSVALLGLLVSIAVSRMLLTTDDASKRVVAWPGISLAIAAVGLVLAAVVAADALPAQLGEGRWRRPAGLGVLVLTVAACSAPLLAAGSWVATGVRGPIGGAAAPVLPPFVSVSSNTGQRLRTLVMRAEHGTITYEVLRGADPLLGATDLAQPPAAQRTLDAVVSTLAAPGGGGAQDQGQALAAMGIGYILLPTAADATLASTLNSAADLRPVSKTSAFQLWRVTRPAARVRVLEPGGQLISVPSGPVSVSAAAAPRSGGTLELAEPAGGWTATLNGTALQSVPSPAGSWAQAFRLPPGGGTLDISHSQLGRTLIVVLEALALLVVIGLGLPGARVPGESAAGAGAGAERTAGGRRDRSREKPEELAEPGPEPGLEPGSAPGEVEEPSRGSRLSRRAAAAGRTAATRTGAGRIGAGRAGGTRAAPDRAAADRATGRPGRRAAASGPGTSRPGAPRPGAAGLGAGPGAPLSAPGAGRRGTPGPSRSQRHENEDLDAFPGADLAPDGGAAAATGFGAAPGFGSDAAGPLADLPPAVTGSPDGGGFWDQDDSPTMLGDRGSAPWEQVTAPPAAAALAGAERPGGQDDGPAADRGGRKRWLRGRKTKERSAPEPATAVSSASATGADGRGQAGPDGIWPGNARPEYPAGQYAATGQRGGVGPGPQRRGSGDTSGPYPSPSYGSGEYPSGEYRGAGYGGPDYEDTGYGETDYGGARPGDSGPGRTGPRSAGSRSAGYGSGGYPNAGYSGDSDSSGGYSRPGYGDSGPSYGSGQYPQAGQGGRRVSRGRLPGDDDVLPPRRGTASGGYPAEPGIPPAGSGQRGAGYPGAAPPGAAYPGAPDYPESAGYPAGSSRPGRHPGDSSRSDADGSGPGRSDSGWPEPAASSGGYPSPAEPHAAHEGAGYVPAEFPAAEFPAPEYPEFPAPEYSAPEYRGSDYPGPRYPGHDEPGAGDYSGTEYPGPDYPAPGDYPGRRAHVTRGRDPGDEPGEGDW
jgi:GT2 family glycosyltransferase